MNNKDLSAETKADSSTNDDVTSVSQTIANAPVSSSIDWDEWLSNMELSLKGADYRKFSGHSKNEDFGFWKTFLKGDEKIYQIGILFYDFRKYIDRDPSANRIGIQYECMLLSECYSRIDLSVSKQDIDFKDFENMSKTFYEAMSVYCC